MGRRVSQHGRIIAAGIIGMMLTLTAARALADLAAGRDAFNRGDYKAAAAAWRPDAEKGVAEAEFGLGEVYEQGEGDYKKAAFWYEKAARQGDIQARYRLALMAAAGNNHTPPDPVTAYEWAVLASDPHDLWGQLAADLARDLKKQLSPREVAAGQKCADLWRAADSSKAGARAPAPAPVPGQASLPAVQQPAQATGLPGSAPCVVGPPVASVVTPPPAGPMPAGPTPAGPIPAGPMPGAPPPVAPTTFLPPPVPPPTVESWADVVKRAVQQIPCASFRETSDTKGRPVMSATVPDEAARAKLIRVSNRSMPDAAPQFRVYVMPPPLCRSFLAFHDMPAKALASNTLDARLAQGNTVLHEGDTEAVEIKGPDFPTHLRVDYFSLDGRVLHILPRQGETPGILAADARRTIGPWQAGGAPFGTEFIAVLATPERLDLGSRPAVEQARPYISDLERALRRTAADGPHANLVATILVHTAQR